IAELADRVPLDSVGGDRLAADHLRDVGETPVRPTGEGHRPVLEEKLQTVPPRRDLPEIGHAGGPDVRLPYLSTGARGEPVQNRWIGRPLPFGDSLSAGEDRVLIPIRTVDDGGLFGS